LQRLAAWATPPAFAADSDSRFANRVEEELLASTLFDQMLIGWAEDLHDAGQLFLFVLTREDGIASPKLCENATERPHIDAQAVAAAENDFRTAVETRLDVSVDLLLFATRAAKVDDSDVGFPSFTEQDVLRLEIAVNDMLLLQQDQTCHHLTREATDERKGKALKVVRANELVKVDRKTGRDDAEMRAEVERGRDRKRGVGLVRVLKQKVSAVVQPSQM
jgi:hypothetical protein